MKFQSRISQAFVEMFKISEKSHSSAFLKRSPCFRHVLLFSYFSLIFTCFFFRNTRLNTKLKNVKNTRKQEIIIFIALFDFLKRFWRESFSKFQEHKCWQRLVRESRKNFAVEPVGGEENALPVWWARLDGQESA